MDLVLVDEDIAAWVAGLEELFARIAGRFFRSEPPTEGPCLRTGLLAPIADKNGWTLAEIAGDATPDGMQRLPTPQPGTTVVSAVTCAAIWSSTLVTLRVS